jgi:hypothetical protein
MGPQQIQEFLWATISTLVAPAIGASIVTMFVVRWLGGQRLGSVATMLAVATALVVGGALFENSVSEPLPWRLGSETELKVKHFVTVLGWWLEDKPQPKPVDDAAPAEPVVEDDAPPFPPTNQSRYWLVWLAALAMIVEVLLPLLAVPDGPGWAIRTVVALLAGRLLTPNYPGASMRLEHPWVSWALGLVILLEWALLTSLARRWLDGVVAMGLGVCCVMTGLVLISAGHDTVCSYALLTGASLAGPALLSWKWPSDTSAAAAACAVILPSLVLEGQRGYSEDAISNWNFVLAALAPLALLPMWLPFLAKRERWTRWLLGLALPIIPAVIAAAWAMKASTPVTP